VTVQDDGRGFDPAAIPVERLGVRTSILDRMATVGGSADVVSRPGAGTRIELAWGSPEAPVPEPVLGTAGWAE
jgi:signal transduction histidine kinase